MKSIIACVYGIVLLLNFHVGLSRADDEGPIVRVTQGLLRGHVLNDTRGKGFYAFMGIPFAQPPVGNLRFKAPRPAESWSGIFNATTEGAKCPQMDGLKFVGDEDCLTLNIYCPSWPSKNKSMAVAVVIHGGAFLTGSASFSHFSPNRLMSFREEVIFVAIQYRLSSLGFLSTGDSAAEGNFGLRDQLLALRWVQNNIVQFGGDPKRVTIFGGSAGAMSVGLHMVSPLAVGLFRGAVIMSGPPLMNLVIQKRPLSIANLLGRAMNCRSNATSSLVDCLRGKTAREITLASSALILISGQLIPFAPVIEKPGNGSYLIDAPEKLFAEGKFIQVPTMIGCTKDEMAAFVLPFPTVQILKILPMQTSGTIDFAFNVLLPPIWRFYLNYENVSNLTQAVRREYEDEYNFRVTKQFFQFLIDMFTDVMFRFSTDKFSRLLASRVPTYLYDFRYHGDMFPPINFGDKEVDHVQNAAYLFAPNLSQRDNKMADVLGEDLLNFIVRLNPNPRRFGGTRWTPTRDTPQLSYMMYGDDEIAMKEGYYTPKMTFWKNIEREMESGNL